MQSEIFNQKRMDRCVRIQQAIMDNFRKTKLFTYVVHATDSVQEVSLDELRTRYFSVGVGVDVTEIPFTDMLVVFSLIEKELAERDEQKRKGGKQSDIKMEVTTDFPDDEAIRILSQIQAEVGPEKTPIRTALVTARNSPAHERVVRTMRAWNVRIDEAFFMGGVSKEKVLKAFRPHIFFDDQEAHCHSAARVVPTVRVPRR